MNTAPLLTPTDIARLINGSCISQTWPWASEDEPQIEDHLKAACAAVARATGALSRIEWNHYGSGYASFVDAWFYKTSAAFNASKSYGDAHEHTGLVVLLSRLSPYFVFMQGEQHWGKKGGTSYMPEFDHLDRIENPAIAELARQVQPVLENHGMVRAWRSQLSEALPEGTKVPTILNAHGLTQFDALFYWED